MITCNKYTNLVVFHFLNQTWNNNNLDYILSKYYLIFNIAPDKIIINYSDNEFINILNEYKYKWRIGCLTENEIKILYFCYCLCGYNNSVDNYYINGIDFNYFTKIYKKFFWSYDNITNNNMMYLLHVFLRNEIKSFLQYNDEKFKYLWLSDKLNNLKNH